MRNLIKLIDHVVSTARLDAAIRRVNENRHIAEELRHAADGYDALAAEQDALLESRFGDEEGTRQVIQAGKRNLARKQRRKARRD